MIPDTKAMRELHFLGAGGWCFGCGLAWPCPTAVLCDYIDALQAAARAFARYFSSDLKFYENAPDEGLVLRNPEDGAELVAGDLRRLAALVPKEE